MKRFAAVTLAVLMLLTVFASAASAADSTVEIRGPVYNGSDIDRYYRTHMVTVQLLQSMLQNLQHSITTLTTT